MQLVLCGDFAQLPPVTPKYNAHPFCFHSSVWQSAGLDRTGTVVLQTVHRQASDQVFVGLLTELRAGRCSEATLRTVAGCNINRKPQPSDGILPTRLYCTNRDVDAENETRLRQLDGDERSFSAKDAFDGARQSYQQEKLRALMEKRVVGRLCLKVGAQVVLVRNHSSTLANGSRGVVVDLRDWKLPAVTVRFDNGEVVPIEPVSFSLGGGGGTSLSRNQLPLKLGWALTVHRAQVRIRNGALSLSLSVFLCLSFGFS
jgi:ATP-dependent DNA helicase PIF1